VHGVTRTPAGDRWRGFQDLARGQAVRLGDPEWTAAADPYADRVDSFRAGQRTDANVVNFLAARAGADASVLEVGAGAGRLSLPLAARVGEIIAVEPSPGMAAALAADARAAGQGNVRVVQARWEELDALIADGVFAAHVVYALPAIEDFLLRIQRAAREWSAVIVFGEPPQARLFDFWPAVFGEPRQPNPSLPQLLDVVWSLGVYPEVAMLEVPIWPLGPASRARNGLRRRLHITPGSAADARLEAAMTDLLVDWGDGVLGPRDRRPLPLGIVHWRVTHRQM
jgi:SAM-dependent methyltransferase